MSTLRLSLIAALAVVGVACVEPVTSSDDTELAQNDVVATVPATPDMSADTTTGAWISGETLHANTRLDDYAGANERKVHSLWIAGSNANRVPLTISARAGDGYDVRIAVLGPLTNGSRAVLAADGYSLAKRSVSVTLDVGSRGEHLVVIGSHGLANDTFYELTAQCDNCDSRVDVLASPKFYGLVGNDQRIVSALLGDVMLGYNADVEVEVWTSPPMQSWNATKVSTSYASGTQVNAILPATVAAGDDVRLVVREAGGRVLDTGVTTRYVPAPNAFARLDAVLYGDIASLQIGGVVGFFEGQADLRLRSETHGREIAQDIAHVDYPGHVGNGFNAFDATFLPDYSVAATDGELLSVGFVNGNGDYRRLGCFEYCNNLSGLSSCTGGPRACP